LGPISS
jgi:hypothetical protein